MHSVRAYKMFYNIAVATVRCWCKPHIYWTMWCWCKPCVSPKW